MRSGRARAALAAVVLALGVAGCDARAYHGEWEVVGYRRPGISVLGDHEAMARLGSRFELTREVAVLDGDTCVVGEAARQTLSVRDVEMEYNLMRDELALAREDVEVVDLRCDAGDIDFGHRLIRIGPDSVLAPWGGIFLLLEKRPS